MKNQKFTQFLSCAVVFAVMSSCTACGEKKSGENNNNTENKPSVPTEKGVTTANLNLRMEVEYLKGLRRFRQEQHKRENPEWSVNSDENSSSHLSNS